MLSKKEQNALNRTIRDESAERIKSRDSFISNERERFERFIGRFEVLLAADLDRGATAVESLPKGDWKKWATTLLPNRDEKTVYRWRNAGRVARILQGDGTEARPDLLGEIPMAAIGHLVPFYRVLPTGKEKTNADAIAAAEDLIRATWSKLVADLDDEEIIGEDGETVIVGMPPTVADATAAAEKVAPTNRSGGGGGGKDSADDDDDDDESGDRGTTPVQVDPKAVEAASGPVAAIVQQQADALSADPILVKTAMLAALRLAEEHGISTVQAVLSAAAAPVPSDVDPTPTADDESAADESAAAAEKVA